jgi:integrase
VVSNIVSVYKRGKIYWYKFTWRGELFRETTRQTNANVARQMEAAHRTSLAKGEVGIREKKPVPTLKEFAENDFLPFVRSTFKKKRKTLLYYENGVKNLLHSERMATEKLQDITTGKIAEYVTSRQSARGKHGVLLQIASINRELQVLRRILRLAEEWGRVEKALPKVSMLPGERHRERVLTISEEDLYFRAATSDAMNQYADPTLLHDVARTLLDCGVRPEECFRLRRANIAGNNLEVHFGKTENARRKIPMTGCVRALLEMRLERSGTSPWVFPARTQSGHIEPSTLKKQHNKAIAEATRILREETGNKSVAIEPFELYTLRHTCLTRWAPHMDPWTLAYLAGHRDMNTTKRYIHPEERTIQDAMTRARVARITPQDGHKPRHNEGAMPLSESKNREVIQ